MTFVKKYRFVFIAIAVYMVIFGVITAFRHYNFQTQTWDMGVFDQLFWNTIHGHVMQGSIEELPSHFGIHWSPGLLLLAPGYALFPSPYYLLFVQVLALAAGAWPLYLLASRTLQRKPLAKLIAVSYLAYPALHWVNLFDVHEIAFFIPLMLAGMYFVESGRRGPGACALILAASMKEDAIVGVLFYALYRLVRNAPDAPHWWTRERALALIACAGVIAYFVLAITVFMPAFGGGLLRLDRYAELGNSPGGIAGNLLMHPALFFRTVMTLPKFMYVLWLLIPVAGLPLASGSALLVLVPGLLENLLTTYQSQFSGFYQYDALLIPGMFFAAIIGAGHVLRRAPRYAHLVAPALVAGTLMGFVVRSPVNPLTFPFGLFGTNERWDGYRQMLEAQPVDANASVAAETNLLPHLAHRERVYPLGAEPVLADVALIDTEDAFGFRDAATFASYVAQYTKNTGYSTVVYGGHDLVARKIR